MNLPGLLCESDFLSTYCGLPISRTSFALAVVHARGAGLEVGRGDQGNREMAKTSRAAPRTDPVN